jgi:hypothetical protein
MPKFCVWSVIWRHSVLHDGPGCYLKIFIFAFRQFSTDYHKLFTYPCAVCNDVRLGSPSVPSDLFSSSCSVCCNARNMSVAMSCDVPYMPLCGSIRLHHPLAIRPELDIVYCTNLSLRAYGPCLLTMCFFSPHNITKGTARGWGSVHRSSVHCITGPRSGG